MLDQTTQTEALKGKPFPCPLCKKALPVEISQKQKPYCVCNSCGIQLFFRGKPGIKLLIKLLENENLIQEENPGAILAVSLYNRVEQLKQQRSELEKKQGIFFRDENLANAISTIDAEIAAREKELLQIRKKAEKSK